MVQTVLDGNWRSLDGRPMHEAVVALSELHETLFSDELVRSLGVQVHPMADLTAACREGASRVLGHDVSTLASITGKTCLGIYH